MNYVKTFGLVVIAAAAMLAFIGSSSASASIVCKTTPTTGGSTTGTTCPSGWAYSAGTEMHAIGISTFKIHTVYKTIECTSSTMSGKTGGEGSATETVGSGIETLTFAGCNCEVKVLKNGTQEFHWVSDTFNATVTGNGQELTTTCSTIFGNVHCIYVTNNTELGSVTGSPVHTGGAIIHWHFSLGRNPTSGLCAEEATVTGTYELTTATPMWFAAHT